jgi:hypothetical protein
MYRMYPNGKISCHYVAHTVHPIAPCSVHTKHSTVLAPITGRSQTKPNCNRLQLLKALLGNPSAAIYWTENRKGGIIWQECFTKMNIFLVKMNSCPPVSLTDITVRWQDQPVTFTFQGQLWRRNISWICDSVPWNNEILPWSWTKENWGKTAWQCSIQIDTPEITEGENRTDKKGRRKYWRKTVDMKTVNKKMITLKSSFGSFHMQNWVMVNT